MRRKLKNSNRTLNWEIIKECDETLILDKDGNLKKIENEKIIGLEIDQNHKAPESSQSP
jgi:hypothetical protein